MEYGLEVIFNGNKLLEDPEEKFGLWGFGTEGNLFTLEDEWG